jgi:hypothetical protein
MEPTRRIPIKLKGGPGIPGMIAPSNPPSKNKNARASSKNSIFMYF